MTHQPGLTDAVAEAVERAPPSCRLQCTPAGIAGTATYPRTGRPCRARSRRGGATRHDPWLQAAFAKVQSSWPRGCRRQAGRPARLRSISPAVPPGACATPLSRGARRPQRRSRRRAGESHLLPERVVPSSGSRPASGVPGVNRAGDAVSRARRRWWLPSQSEQVAVVVEAGGQGPHQLHW